MRPDNDDYMSKGYVPLREQYDNSVSHALEYYIADFALSRFADALGKKKDAEMFYKRSLGYKHYYSKEFGTFRPILPDGTSTVRSIRGRERTLNRIPVSTKVILGIILSMYHMMYMDWLN